jgi:hypothetical protein
MIKIIISPESGSSYATAALTIGMFFNGSREYANTETSATWLVYSNILAMLLTPQVSAWESNSAHPIRSCV